MALESQNAAVIWGTPAEQSGDDWSASVPLAFSKVWKPNPASEDACAPVGGGTLNLQSSFVGRIGRWWWAPQWKAKASDHAPEARPCPRTGRARGSQVIGFYYSFNRMQRLLNWRRKGWIDQQFTRPAVMMNWHPCPFSMWSSACSTKVRTAGRVVSTLSETVNPEPGWYTNSRTNFFNPSSG